MKIFSALYDKALVWSRHRRAPVLLCGVSFSESVIFPIPVDVMLAPMVLAQPSKAFQLAWLTTIFSVLGGMAGYLLGWLAYEPLVVPALAALNYDQYLYEAQAWFEQWGVWVIFLAGFSPIPYKVFTVTAGVMLVAFWPFVLASLVGRGMRFFLVAWLVKIGGPFMENYMRRHMDTVGWAMVVLALVLYFWLR